MSDYRFLQDGFDAQLSHVIEECGEVLAAAGKTQRHGRDGVNPLLPSEQQETNEQWLKRELRDLRQAIVRLEVTMGVLPEPLVLHGYRLYWVGEQSEVVAARTAQEAKAFVEGLTGEAVLDDEVGEVLKDAVGSDGQGGITTLYQTFRELGPLTEPAILWTAYA